MANSLELIRAKIAELEAKLSDLRIAERELVALEPARARTRTAPRTQKLKPIRRGKVAAPGRQTMTAAITEVLNAHGALPAAEIAEHIKAGGREIGKRTISHSLQALKKQGRVEGPRWQMDAAKGPREARLR
jgi:ribosomal protein L9